MNILDDYKIEHKTECPGCQKMKKPNIVDLIFMNMNPQDFHDSLIFTEYEVIFLSKIASNNLQLQQM